MAKSRRDCGSGMRVRYANYRGYDKQLFAYNAEAALAAQPSPRLWRESCERATSEEQVSCARVMQVGRGAAKVAGASSSRLAVVCPCVAHVETFGLWVDSLWAVPRTRTGWNRSLQGGRGPGGTGPSKVAEWAAVFHRCLFICANGVLVIE